MNRRLRFLFPACEEVGYLGTRMYVRDLPPAGVIGVLSLELCGIGDSVAVWDAGDETPFLRSVGGALDDLGLRRDEGWHQVGRIPVFGSDHRAFAAVGVPAYGLSVVPVREADALRHVDRRVLDDAHCLVEAHRGREAPRAEWNRGLERRAQRGRDLGTHAMNAHGLEPPGPRWRLEEQRSLGGA